MAKNRIYRDIPELVKVLRDQKARVKDMIVPSEKMSFVGDEDGLALSVEGKAYGIQEQVHPQLAGKFWISGHYYSALREKKAFDLLATNLEYWRERSKGENRLVRLIDADVRGFLSDRYRPIDHLDIATIAIQVVTGRDAEGGKEKPWAKGAKAFDWGLTPTRMNLGFFNPGIQINLCDLKAGVQFNKPGGYDPDAPNHGWVKGAKEEGAHWVFPAGFVENSETGHGGASVQVGLFEAACDNSSRIGTNLVKRHLGESLENEDFYSPETLRKRNSLIFAQIADVFRSVFDPELFLANAKKMKGLAEIEIEVKEAVAEIVKLPGMTEEVRDDILAAYEPLQDGKDTLLDVQRAVTAAAHAHRQKSIDTAIALEELGGAMIEKGVRALETT